MTTISTHGRAVPVAPLSKTSVIAWIQEDSPVVAAGLYVAEDVVSRNGQAMGLLQ
jgi:predicted metalloprotease with PDZ domain